MKSNEAGLGQELVDIASTLASQAGTMALLGRRAGIGDVQTKTTSTDMVTEFDKASEKLIVEGLTLSRPDDAIVGEEGTFDPGTSGVTWYIDPIDGTTNFLYSLPNWAVSIGATDESGTLAGVVYIPALDELFTAIRGEGAHLNGSPIHCNSSAVLAHALLSTGFSYSSASRTVQAQRIAQLIHLVRDIRRLGAASIDLCYVACGRFDAYFEENLAPWDFVAGELIAREAGCRTGNFVGQPVTPSQLLVAVPDIFDELAKLIVDSSTHVGQE
ncbi:MAG: inositol monophosphatase family protein [Ilumatobacteraceae bacterium]